MTRGAKPGTVSGSMFIARVVAGRWYWCISCRHCQTTVALCIANDATVPAQAIAEPIQCYSCLQRAAYAPEDCLRLQAQAEGVPWLRWE